MYLDLYFVLFIKNMLCGKQQNEFTALVDLWVQQHKSCCQFCIFWSSKCSCVQPPPALFMFIRVKFPTSEWRRTQGEGQGHAAAASPKSVREEAPDIHLCGPDLAATLAPVHRTDLTNQFSACPVIAKIFNHHLALQFLTALEWSHLSVRIPVCSSFFLVDVCVFCFVCFFLLTFHVDF